MSKTLGTFKLNVQEGSFTNNEIIVLLGENGCGKTTLIKMLTGSKTMLPDDTSIEVKNIFYNRFLPCQ
jgi:ATP-binding cassette subfamily E protein 1